MGDDLRAAGAVEIKLSIEAGEPITGTIAMAGEPAPGDPQMPERFCGWMELMAAITARQHRVAQM